jgi:hypothetical protein
MSEMSNFLEVITNGTDDPNDVLRAAQYAIRNGLTNGEGREVIQWALDEFGPEQVYMDGEIFA